MAAAANEPNRRENYVIDTGMAIATVTAKLAQLQKVQSNIQQLNQFGQDVSSNPQTVSTLKERWMDLMGKFKDAASSKIEKILAKGEECLSECDCECIKEEVEQLKVKMAKETVLLGAIVSASIIMVQIWRLREVWMAVKDAKNVIFGSVQKIKLIKVKIEELQDGAIELRALMTQYEVPSATDQDKRKLLRKLRMKASRMSTTYIDARTMISELKVQIEGKTQVLAVYQREQVTNAIMNGMHGMTNLVQCFQFSGMLGPGFQILQGGITASFFGLAIGNTVMYHITEKTIKEIRKVMAQLDQMEVQLASISRTIHDAEEFVVLHEEDY